MVLKNLFGKKGQKKKFESSNANQTETTEETQASDSAQQHNEPTPALHLENAMVENARNDTQETRAKVYQELLFSDLLLALADTGATSAVVNEDTVSAEHPSWNVAILTYAKGVQFHTVLKRQ